MKFRETHQGIYFPCDPLVTVDEEALQRLHGEASENPLGRARYCAHPDPEDSLHEMLICLDASTWVRPHRHSHCESMHVISGACDVVLFDDTGRVTRVISVGEFGSGRPFFLRMNESVFHTQLIRSPALVFHETCSGPFRRESTEFASWAPSGDDLDAVASYSRDLETQVRAKQANP